MSQIHPDGALIPCGHIAIVGRPNVGKSTLLNHLLGQKISITSRKPQTTRHQIIGVKTTEQAQMIFVDTPGMHIEEPKALNRYMNQVANNALADVDLIVFMLSGLTWNVLDQHVLTRVIAARKPTLLLINKVDHIEQKELLLPFIDSRKSDYDYRAILPISALKEHNLEALESEIIQYLPESPPLYPEDQITNRTQRFLFAEIVREKLMRQLGDELPHELTVEIEQFVYESPVWKIGALILVERDGQKAIVIGKSGKRLKQIGQEARKDMEQILEHSVMLNLWVKVKSGWSDDARALQSLGYTDVLGSDDQ